MGIENPGLEEIKSTESTEKQGIDKSLMSMLKDRAGGFFNKAQILGIEHPAARKLAVMGALTALIMIVRTPDFDLLGGVFDMGDEMTKNIEEAVNQQGVVPEAIDLDKVFYDESWWDNPGYEDRWPADLSAGRTQQPNPIGIGLEKTPVDPGQKQAVEWLGTGNENLMENPLGDKEPFSGSYPDFPDEKRLDEIKKAVEGGDGNIGDINKDGGGVKIGEVPGTSFKANEVPGTSFKIGEGSGFKANEVPDTSFKVGKDLKGEINIPGNDGQDPVKLGKVVKGEASETMNIGGGDEHKKVARLGKLINRIKGR